MTSARSLDAEVAPDERIGVLLADTVSAPGFRSGRRLQRVSGVDVARSWRHPLLVLSAASTLPGVAHVAAGANRQHRLRGLLIRRDVGTGLLGVRILKTMLEDKEVCVRRCREGYEFFRSLRQRRERGLGDGNPAAPERATISRRD